MFCYGNELKFTYTSICSSKNFLGSLALAIKGRARNRKGWEGSRGEGGEGKGGEGWEKKRGKGEGRERGVSPLKHKNLTPPMAKSLILHRHA
jgi:hypothetical protein